MTPVQVSALFFISGQIRPEDVTALAEAGFVALINNRPDGEAPDQPGSAEIEAAAQAAGLDYLHAPMHGAEIALDDVERIHSLTARATGKVLGFCRSGARSLLGWALASAAGRAAEGGEHALAALIEAESAVALDGLLHVLD